MNKTLIIAFAAASLAAVPAFAADSSTSDPAAEMKSEGQMNPTAGQGVQPNQQPGAETSDRTPDKTTPAPGTQVDKAPTGETSDRTPENHNK